MDNNENFNIHVTLNDWRLALHIPRADEEIFRYAEKLFNDEFARSLQIYRLPREETLKMIAYNFAVHLVREHEKYKNLVEKMQSWGSDVDNILND